MQTEHRKWYPHQGGEHQQILLFAPVQLAPLLHWPQHDEYLDTALARPGQQQYVVAAGLWGPVSARGQVDVARSEAVDEPQQ